MRQREPIEPPPCRWELPDPRRADEHGVCGAGADLDPSTLLAAYRSGLFPMNIRVRGRRNVLGWWSPDPRGIIPLDGLHVSRTLQRDLRHFDVTHDTCFRDVMSRCGDPSRPHGWINSEFIDAYDELHRLGWAHSVEVWRADRLVGGLYGVRINGLFAGESMFHADEPDGTNASKVAMVATVAWLRATGGQLFDVQWTTPHLRTMGAVDITRSEYLQMVAAAVALQPG
jgi:leucyl/phenylalanyl-tRNA---protein transferase